MTLCRHGKGRATHYTHQLWLHVLERVVLIWGTKRCRNSFYSLFTYNYFTCIQGSNWQSWTKIKDFCRTFQDYFGHFQGHLYSICSVWEQFFFWSWTKSRSDLSTCKNIFTMSSHFQGLSRTTTEIQALSSAWKSSPEIQGLLRTFQDSTNPGNIFTKCSTRTVQDFSADLYKINYAPRLKGLTWPYSHWTVSQN